MKKLLAILLSMAMTATAISGCSNSSNNNETSTTAQTESQDTSQEQTETQKDFKDFKIAMITDTGGVNDQSFNQSSWEGLQKLQSETGASIKYIESKQTSDFSTNLDKLADEGNDLIWGIGFALSDAILAAAQANPDLKYAIVDNSYEETPSNLTGVMFRAQEPSFIVGYIAGKTTKTDKVGFVGGITSNIIDQFQYGFQAGVDYAAKELNKTISVDVQYAESFGDAAKGKGIATRMISDGCDIVYHAAGGAGTGVIEAAKEANVFAIGVDRDQAYLAPDNVLTSALKLVGEAVNLVSQLTMNGEEFGGQTLTFGLKEKCVGIPEEHKNMSDEVYNAAIALEEKIINGEIVPPYNKETYDAFMK